MVKISINDTTYPANEEENVLHLLIREGIDIPYLCFHEALSPYGSCRLCLVQVTGGGKPGVTPSCTLPVSEGLKIKTDTPEVVRIRKILLELYLAEAPGSDKIRALAKKYGVESSRFNKIDRSAKGDRCVLCGLCVRVCSEVLGVGAINFSGRGTKTNINTPWCDTSDACIGCGACAYVCPADAIDIIDKEDERIMKSWHNTSLKRTACAASKKYFATEKGLHHVYHKRPEFPEDLKDLSPESRSKKIAAEFFLKPKNS